VVSKQVPGLFQHPDMYPEDARRILVLTEECDERTHEGTYIRSLDGKLNYVVLSRTKSNGRVVQTIAIIPDEFYAIVLLKKRTKIGIGKEPLSIYVFIRDLWRAVQLT